MSFPVVTAPLAGMRTLTVACQVRRLVYYVCLCKEREQGEFIRESNFYSSIKKALMKVLHVVWMQFEFCFILV